MKKFSVVICIGICFLTACNGSTENNPDQQTTGSGLESNHTQYYDTAASAQDTMQPATGQDVRHIR